MIKQISSLQNPLIKELASLRKNKNKIKNNMFIVDGYDFIELALETDNLLYVLIADEEDPSLDVEQIIVTKEIIKYLSPNVTSSKILGVCKYPSFEFKNEGKYVYLDGVQDPGNVGTIIRTALAFSYNGVILSQDSASIYNDKVISATKGAIFKLPIYQNISLFELKEKSFQLIATGLKNNFDYHNVVLKDNFVIIMGSEGNGVKEENLLLSDYICKIEMANIDSLNVAIAAGILMNDFR